ncbi:LysR family transcriptional regulator [Sphingomonas sp. LB3N6]|uniref:LysR family transcriptional regulator n=1 Tax=Sphingomonas fucosidasi TaxID=3096164 RepID=UPI002FC7FE3B
MLTDAQPRLPALGSLRAFEAAARHRSMMAAATELNVTHGAVSKQVQSLEAEIGTRLFERRNRGIHLTRQGAWLAERLKAAFADLHRTMRDFRKLDDVAGPLTVSCEPTLCLRLLIPALGELKQATGLDVRLLAAGGPVDFVRDHIDVAIRRSDFPLPPGVGTATLAAEHMGPVLRPDLAGANSGALPRLRSETRPDAWQGWDSASFSGPAIGYQHFYMAIQAAEAGQGVVMASFHMVADALASGRLAAPYGFLPDGTHYLAIWPTNSIDPRRAMLTEWLKSRMIAPYT